MGTGQTGRVQGPPHPHVHLSQDLEIQLINLVKGLVSPPTCGSVSQSTDKLTSQSTDQPISEPANKSMSHQLIIN